MNQERRIETRLAKRVMLSVKKADEPKPFMALTMNVSPMGMFVATSRLYPRGTRLVVAQTGDPRQTQVEVEVVRIVRQDPLLGGCHTGMGLRLIPAPQPAAVATDAPSSTTEAPVYPLTFRDAAEFLEVLRRDLKHGGAFVRCATLPRIHDVVTVSIVIPLRENRTLRFAARVVYRKEGADSGFGVEFLDRAALTTALLDPRRAA